jgi:predicted RNase H-like HicB family nuclease
MIVYPVKVEQRDPQSIVVTFFDVPEATVVADTEDDAYGFAVVALDQVLSSYIAERRSLPQPSEIVGGPTITTYKFKLDHCR